MAILRGVVWFDLDTNEIIVKEVYNNYLNYCKYKVEDKDILNYLINKKNLDVKDIMKIRFIKSIYTKKDLDIPVKLF